MRDELLETLRDLPRWVEPRSALLEGATLFGRPDACAIVARERDANIMFVVGVPDREALRDAAALDPTAEVILYADALGGRSRGPRRVVVFSLPREWQAEEDNAASMGLARKLGFEPIDELFVWRASAILDALA